MKEKIVKSKTGYSCPNCDYLCFDIDNTLISKTEPEFKYTKDGDPIADWEEVWKCCKCGTVYSLINGY